MSTTLKKGFLSLLLTFIVFSFSGCMGIQMPGGGSQRISSSPERNDSQGVFKTIDGGKTWQHKVTIQGSQTGLDQMTIGSMAIDPENSNIVYVGTLGNGMYKTEDGGDSWYQINDQNGKLRNTAGVYDIAVESGNSNIVYAATLNESRGVLLRSEDGGKSWGESYISTELGKQINRVQIDRKSKNIVYIGTEQGGVLKSQNRGINWSDIGWFDYGVKDFVVDYTNTKGLVVLTEDGIFKTTDGGADKEKSWMDVGKNLRDSQDVEISRMADLNSISIDEQNPLVMYMTYNNVVLTSHDGGMNWTTMKTVTPATTASETTPIIYKIWQADGVLYYGCGNALYKSDTKGQTWSTFDIPILGDVKYTVSDAKNPSIIYVGSFYQTK